MCQYSQIQDLKNCPETNAYRQQFEHAQQMLRENQAELSEVRGLFADLQMTAHKQVGLKNVDRWNAFPVERGGGGVCLVSKTWTEMRCISCWERRWRCVFGVRDEDRDEMYLLRLRNRKWRCVFGVKDHWARCFIGVCLVSKWTEMRCILIHMYALQVKLFYFLIPEVI